MQPGPGLLGTFKCLFGLSQVCESCLVKGCVFKAGSKVENLSIHSQKMRTFSMISLTFFCALKHCSELSKYCSRLLLLKIRTGLNPGNEARPINPFPSFIFWLSFHFSRCQNRSFFAPKANGNACYAGYFRCSVALGNFPLEQLDPKSRVSF